MDSKEANDLFEAGHREACLGLDRPPAAGVDAVRAAFDESLPANFGEAEMIPRQWSFTRAEVGALIAEIDRLKRGEFTEEEFQNLCHHLTAEDACKFARGCVKYNWSLFGDRCRLQMVPDVPRVRRDD